MSVVLRCTVRSCGESLHPEGAKWACVRHHSFDLHRSGLLNLLQPQDRRSAKPGDSREAALARRRLALIDHAEAVHRAFGRIVESRAKGRPAALLDVGCGEGAFLRSLDGIPALERHGLDLSSAALELAAKASPQILFVVANADRCLPYVERSFDVVTSIDARLNAPEFARILKPGGLVVMAAPSGDDLIELREVVQGGRVYKSKGARIEEELAGPFKLLDRLTVRDRRSFDPSALRDLLVATYRGGRRSQSPAIEALTEMTVTLSHEILVFERV